MNPLQIVTILFLASLGQVGAGPIPYPEFYISVETNNFLDRAKGKMRFAVRVSVARSSEASAGKTSLHVNCYAFGPGVRGFDDADQSLFLQAAATARYGREFSATIVSPGRQPPKN